MEMDTSKTSNQYEFTTQAYSKMIMHAMKYAHKNCGGFLLGPRADDNNKQSIKPSNNRGDSQDEIEKSGDEESDRKVAKPYVITEAIPVNHASFGLTPNVEVAFNSVTMYANQQDLMICGYYHADKFEDSNGPDIFSQKIAEKLCENYPKAVLCFMKFDSISDNYDTFLVPYQYTDGKWRKRSSDTFSVDQDKKVIFDKILLSKEKLYRDMVDFDDHLDDISLDWTNSKISQKIDHIISNVF